MKEEPITRKWEGGIQLTTSGKGTFKLVYHIEYGPTLEHGRVLDVREAEAIAQQLRNELYRLTKLNRDPADPCSSCLVDEVIREMSPDEGTQTELVNRLCKDCKDGSRYRPREGYE